MSDFVYCSSRKKEGECSAAILSIYHERKPQVREFHGSWGSLAVSENLYRGFSSVETDDELFVVIGAPLLTFMSNLFLGGDKDAEITGTIAVRERWAARSGICWDEDLSGPFVVVKLDKATGELAVITDLMSFIPVYHTCRDNVVVIGTHVDVVADVAGCLAELDPVSAVDFIYHGIITYPFTFYSGVQQLAPASMHVFFGKKACSNLTSTSYWLPLEEQESLSLADAATVLRDGLRNYVDGVTEGMEQVGLFLSGGEDSRTVLSLLPARCRKDAFVFLDGFNREGRIAQRAAAMYGAGFTWLQRSKTRSLEVLKPCCDLVGAGAQYTHVHSYGYESKAGLQAYPAVFGGLFSDAMCKGSRIRKIKAYKRMKFLPQVKCMRFSQSAPVQSHVVPQAVLDELHSRRKHHHDRIMEIRPQSSHEWFELWPNSMNSNSPNFYGNRRLFRSYEPFIAKDVVKLAACVPQSWKLNRRLFHRMAQPLLKPSKTLPHGDGWYPYYPWTVNLMVRPFPFYWYKLQRRLRLVTEPQGPWGDWEYVMNSSGWKERVTDILQANTMLDKLMVDDIEGLFDGESLDSSQKINLMQCLYQLKYRLGGMEDGHQER